MNHEQQCIDELKLIFNKSYYDCLRGVSLLDIDIITSILNEGSLNDSEKNTNFPDFISDKGLIEIFKVTSGKETKKGAEYEKIRANTENHTFQRLDSIDNLLSSFKRNWEKHIDSLRKYKNSNDIKEKAVIFYCDIDYVIPKVHLSQEILKKLHNVCFQIDNHPEKSLCYCRDLLDYLYQFIDDVDLVVLKTKGFTEIIKIETIPSIIEVIFYPRYEYHNLKLTENSKTYCTKKITFDFK